MKVAGDLEFFLVTFVMGPKLIKSSCELFVLIILSVML